MYPYSTHAIDAIGASAARLLSSGPAWITRRKERVTLLDETAVRRQMSVDFELPHDVAPVGLWLNERVWYAPLFFLQKGSDEPFDPDGDLRKPEPHFANFDLRDERGRALSLPPRTWNAAVTAAMLATLIRDGLHAHGRVITPSVDFAIAAIAAEICRAARMKAEQLVAKLRDPKDLSGAPLAAYEAELFLLDARDPFIRRMLDACAVASVVMVPRIGASARRGILKLAYDHEIVPLDGAGRLRPTLASTGLLGYDLWIDTLHRRRPAPLRIPSS
jgi:hypothetical protein